MRSADFFEVDEQATIEINGGSPPIYVLNERLLGDLRSGPLPFPSDISAAEGLLDLVEDELVEYATSADKNELEDERIALAIRALEAVTRRLRMPVELPFRNFTTFRTHWIRNGVTGTGSWQARREIVGDLLEPHRKQLASLQRGLGVLRSKKI